MANDSEKKKKSIVTNTQRLHPPLSPFSLGSVGLSKLLNLTPAVFSLSLSLKKKKIFSPVHACAWFDTKGDARLSPFRFKSPIYRFVQHPLSLSVESVCVCARAR